MKEPLINFLFQQENLYYIEDFTLELIPVKKPRSNLYKEREKYEIVVTDELLKSIKLEKEKKGSKKGGKQKKSQKKNKKKH
ncbi:hypothetical protein RclHR1_05340002 [Rhizophagus clarus]|nr:hypothetical protein RclHR1_05340002 [Rhizophagus clarus]